MTTAGLAPGSDNRSTIDRRLYAILRAQGEPMYRAAQKSGSRAKDMAGAYQTARTVEKDPRVQALIKAHRGEFLRLAEDCCVQAMNAARDWISDPTERYELRIAGLNFLKGLLPKKLELSGAGGGPLQVALMDGEPATPEEQREELLGFAQAFGDMQIVAKPRPSLPSPESSNGHANGNGRHV